MPHLVIIIRHLISLPGGWFGDSEKVKNYPRKLTLVFTTIHGPQKVKSNKLLAAGLVRKGGNQQYQQDV